MSIPAGETACLGAAFLWAFSVQLFAAPIARHGARAVNLFKCSFATLLLGLTLIAMGSWRSWPDIAGMDLLWIAVSGLVGLTIGDTALFAAVNTIGPHRSLLLQTAAPVFAAAIAWPLGERIGTGQVAAAAVILVGILIVLQGGRPRSASAGPIPVVGVALGLLAALGQGAGVVIAKAGMDSVPVLTATFVRLGVGAAGLVVIAILGGSLGRSLAAGIDRETLPRLATASFFGTYLAMLLMMAGVAWAPASIAAVLLATPPVFSLALESLSTRRWPSTAGLIGTLIAVAGVAALALSG